MKQTNRFIDSRLYSVYSGTTHVFVRFINRQFIDTRLYSVYSETHLFSDYSGITRWIHARIQHVPATGRTRHVIVSHRGYWKLGIQRFILNSSEPRPHHIKECVARDTHLSCISPASEVRMPLADHINMPETCLFSCRVWRNCMVWCCNTNK